MCVDLGRSRGRKSLFAPETERGSRSDTRFHQQTRHGPLDVMTHR